MSNQNKLQVWKNSISTGIQISEFGMYTGSTVLKILEKERITQHQHSLEFIRNYANALADVQHLLDTINSWCYRIADAALLVGSGDKLCAWLLAKDVHKNLITTLHLLKTELDTQRSRRLNLIPIDDPMMALMVTEVEQLATACTKAQGRDSDDGAAVLAWLAERHAVWQTMNRSFKQYVDLGGRPETPLLQAIWRVGYADALQMHPRWKSISKSIWNKIEGKLEVDRSADEEVIYTEWKRKSIDQHRKQVEWVFKTLTVELVGM
jgi:hypothetical protein